MSKSTLDELRDYIRSFTVREKTLICIIVVVSLVYLYEGTDHAKEEKYLRCIEGAGGTKYGFAQCIYFKPDKDK